MGYLRHKALIVNGWDAKAVELAHDAVAAIYEKGGMRQLVSPVVSHVTNGGASFFVAPDGSKEGWDTSDRGDELLDEAKDLLDTHAHLDWCEVLCGGDDDEFAVLGSSAQCD